MSTEFSHVERFKSVLLDEANAREDLGLAYWWAKEAFPERTSSEQIEVTNAALRDLLDRGLIVLFRAGYDDHSDCAVERGRLHRDEIEAAFSAGGSFPDGGRHSSIWLATTEKGSQYRAALPSEALPEWYRAQ